VAFSADGRRVVSGSKDRTVRVWDATTGETVAGPFKGHADWVLSVAFSPNGCQIVSGSKDRTIRVWDATTGETVAGPFTGHTDSVNSVAFSPDGNHVLSGSSDQTVRTSSVAKWKDNETGSERNDVEFEFEFADRHLRSVVIDDEGWLRGGGSGGGSGADGGADGDAGGELLIWIPPIHREGGLHLLPTTSTSTSADEHHGTRLDVSDFVHGHSWTTCIDPR